MIKKNIGKINGIDYNEYIHSDEWKKKRVEVAKREHHICQMCGKTVVKSYQIHHKTYKRFGNEDLDDLMFLCEDCHAKIHRLKDNNGKTKKSHFNSKKCKSNKKLPKRKIRA